MNKEKLIEAIDKVSQALDIVKEAIDTNTVDTTKTENLELGNLGAKVVEVNYTELLANRMAWSYNTLHPEFRVESQFKNLKDMVSGSKIDFVLNWIKRKGTDGLEDFFKLSTEEQRTQLLVALNNYSDKIREVFAKRFSQQ